MIGFWRWWHNFRVCAVNELENPIFSTASDIFFNAETPTLSLFVATINRCGRERVKCNFWDECRRSSCVSICSQSGLSFSLQSALSSSKNVSLLYHCCIYCVTCVYSVSLPALSLWWELKTHKIPKIIISHTRSGWHNGKMIFIFNSRLDSMWTLTLESQSSSCNLWSCHEDTFRKQIIGKYSNYWKNIQNSTLSIDDRKWENILSHTKAQKFR